MANLFEIKSLVTYMKVKIKYLDISFIIGNPTKRELFAITKNFYF